MSLRNKTLFFKSISTAKMISMLLILQKVMKFLLICCLYSVLTNSYHNNRITRYNCRTSTITLHNDNNDNIMSSEFLLNDKEILSFMRDGHILKRGLINADLISKTVAPSLMQLYNQNILTAYKHKLNINLGMSTEECEDVDIDQCQELLSGGDLYRYKCSISTIHTCMHSTIGL